MISADDINAMAPDYTDDPVMQRVQWEIRSAFEQGFRASAKHFGHHIPNTPLGGVPVWRPYWLYSPARKFLLDNGLIKGNEGYK